MPAPNSSRRSIDRMRDGGGRATMPVECGRIVAMMAMEHRLYLIGEHGVSSGVMADQIDPERQNADIPQVVQRREMNYGVDAPFIQQTLCAAVALVDATYLPEGFPREAALTLALEAAQELAAVTDTVAELRQREASTRERLAASGIDRRHLPTTPNLRGRVEQSIGHLRKVQVGIVTLANLFYPKAASTAPWADSVRMGLQDDPFQEYLDFAVVVLSEIANCRNAMIHGDAMRRLEIRDYDLGADGNFVAPTIEVTHPQTPLARRDAVQFLDVTKDRLADVFANFLSVFCDRNVREMPGMFDTHVASLPDGELRRGSPFFWETLVREGFELGAPPA
jgi:hypothetical protein